MGSDVFKKISKNTGLPEHLVTVELEELLRQAGFDKEQVTLEEIRSVLANYLQDVLLEAKETYSEDLLAADG